VNRAWAFVAFTLVGTVAGQMVLKYAMERHGQVPQDLAGVTSFLGRSLADPWSCSVWRRRSALR